MAEFSKSLRELPSARGDTALIIDTGRTYLRLAALEELAGNQGLAHQHILSAQEIFRVGGREIPEEKLNTEVVKIVARLRPPEPPS